MNSWIQTGITRCVGAPLAYPLSTVYAAGVITACGIATDRIDLATGLVGLTLVTMLVFVTVMRHDVEEVRTLVNGQRTALLERIDVLVNYLIAAGVNLPPGESKGETRE